MEKLSDIVELITEYENLAYSPIATEVRFGCDCGCGGDNYTAKEWNQEVDSFYKTIKKVQDFCTKYGIKYDGYYHDK